MKLKIAFLIFILFSFLFSCETPNTETDAERKERKKREMLSDPKTWERAEETVNNIANEAKKKRLIRMKKETGE